MFITQDYSEHGRYEVIVNNEGRFELEVVDDLIPININSGLPILNLDIRQPWLLILVKVWAKRNGGYNRLKNGKCFEFISAFTNSNWKYYNLSK